MLIEVSDSQMGIGNGIHYIYDIGGRRTQMQIAEARKQGVISQSINYDAQGNVISETDGEDYTTHYEYDLWGNIIKVTYPDGSTNNYEYDYAGHMTKSIDGNQNTTVYTYNSLGQVEKITDSLGQNISYTYDKEGNKASERDRNGQIITYTYNRDGSLTNKQAVGTDEGLQYLYNQKNQLVTALSNDDVLSFVYDANGQVTQKQRNGMPLVNYTYNHNGNQISKTENGELTAYMYDSLGRLQKSGEDSYTYDPAGNRLSWIGSQGTNLYTYDANNRLMTINNSQTGEVTYTYDANGNQIKVSDGTESIYDSFNRLKQTLMPNGDTQMNYYDALDNRYAISENNTVSEFILDGANVIAEITESGQITSRNIRGREILAQEDTNDNINYYLSNTHGDIINLVDPAGDKLNTYTYDAFGNITSNQEQLTNRFQYTGEQYDTTTKNYYLRARYYTPQTGRFTQEDSYRGDGLNLYAYVGNNPINYVDPSGHKIKDIPGRIVNETIQVHLEMGAGVGRKKVRGGFEGQIGMKLVSVNFDYGANGKGEWSYSPSFLEAGAEIKYKNESLTMQIGGKTKYVTDPHLKNGHWENEVTAGINPIKWKVSEALGNASVSWGEEIYVGPGIGGEFSIKPGKMLSIVWEEIRDSRSSKSSDKCK